MATVLKTVVAQVTVGSNPTPSARAVVLAQGGRHSMINGTFISRKPAQDLLYGGGARVDDWGCLLSS